MLVPIEQFAPKLAVRLLAIAAIFPSITTKRIRAIHGDGRVNRLNGVAKHLDNEIAWFWTIVFPAAEPGVS